MDKAVLVLSKFKCPVCKGPIQAIVDISDTFLDKVTKYECVHLDGCTNIGNFQLMFAKHYISLEF